jgi:hypothetical protein
MGQYHKTYNITKREFIHPHRINNGLKLMEQIGGAKSTADALFLLLANSNGRGGGDARPHPTIGRWAGDQIVVQGDYADEKDPAFISEEEREGYTDISGMVADMLAGID